MVPLAEEELEACETICHVLARDGVDMVTAGGRHPPRPRRDGRGRVEWDCGTATAERIMLATGREHRPCTSSTPAPAGLELERGGLRVDEQLRTTTPGIWAIGDAVGGHHLHYQYTHVATHEGPLAVENALTARRTPSATTRCPA